MRAPLPLQERVMLLGPLGWWAGHHAEGLARDLGGYARHLLPV